MGKVVIVTGASRGIGAATAKLLGSSDYKVCVNYLSDKNAADSVCASITDNGGVAFAHKVKLYVLVLNLCQSRSFCFFLLLSVQIVLLMYRWNHSSC